MKIRLYDREDNETYGFMSDEDGEPRGSTPFVDALLAGGKGGGSRTERFAYYARGYSNEHWATEKVDSSN